MPLEFGTKQLGSVRIGKGAYLQIRTLALDHRGNRHDIGGMLLGWRRPLFHLPSTRSERCSGPFSAH